MTEALATGQPLHLLHSQEKDSILKKIESDSLKDFKL
jgi:hypothetical protein